MIVDLLRKRDEALWRCVEEKIVPKVLAGLVGALPDRRWLDREGFLRSAQRTFVRRLDTGTDATIANIETLDDLARYLYVTARNKGRDALRREDVENKHAPKLAKPDEQKEFSDEDAEMANWFLAQLPDDEKEVFILGVAGGKTVEETAEILGCSERHVKRKRAKTRDRLRKANEDSQE